MKSTGKLWAVGLGPGDSELVTFKAAKAINRADVIAFHCARHGRSVALSVAHPFLRDGQIHERLMYPVTTETTDHPAGYRGALEDFYTEASAVLAGHLRAGRNVALLAEGDPLFYSSYMHMHKRLAHDFETEIVPGVTSVSASAMAVGIGLVEGDETLTILPGTMAADELVRRLRDSDAVAIMKLGRTFTKVLAALETAGVAHRAWYVERASTTSQQVRPVREVDPHQFPTSRWWSYPVCSTTRCSPPAHRRAARSSLSVSAPARSGGPRRRCAPSWPMQPTWWATSPTWPG